MFNKLKTTIHLQNENINTEIDNVKKKVSTEILELKNTITKLKIHYRGSTADSIKQKQQ